MNGEKENNLSSPQSSFQTDSFNSTPSLSSPLPATPESASLFGVGGGVVGGIIEESELTPIQYFDIFFSSFCLDNGSLFNNKK